jgi:hypothetical protein
MFSPCYQFGTTPVMCFDRLDLPRGFGGCAFNLGYTLSGDILTTTYAMGTCGDDYGEVSVWKKVPQSSAAASIAEDSVMQEEDQILEIPLGGAAGAIWDFLP